ncbi:hypothetical protein HZU75_00500 [Chitinibacter fontanus]|uniref:Uncharacterized protein n=1 Tax=Chitinibacter fontanus TaxID=1737446 RepID=A0A7D5V7D9_9NEIS|nr:hypothetical protein [Chitinibacter fontanus]QLI80138.1 hypothetical protein HZU75_00500 [Chitinibacter fontanus]
MLSIKQLAFCHTVTFWISLFLGMSLAYMWLNTPLGTSRPGMYLLVWLYFAALIALMIASAALAKALQKTVWLWSLLPLVLAPLGCLPSYLVLSRAARA